MILLTELSKSDVLAIIKSTNTTIENRLRAVTFVTGRHKMSRSLIYHTQLTTNGSVQVMTEDASTSVMTDLSAISKSGMMLSCDRAALDTLFPKSAHFSPKQAVVLNVSFGLPEVGKIETAADVVSVRRLSRDTFELSLKFHQDNAKALDMIDHYVERKLKVTRSSDTGSVSSITQTEKRSINESSMKVMQVA